MRVLCVCVCVCVCVPCVCAHVCEILCAKGLMKHVKGILGCLCVSFFVYLCALVSVCICVCVTVWYLSVCLLCIADSMTRDYRRVNTDQVVYYYLLRGGEFGR